MKRLVMLSAIFVTATPILASPQVAFGAAPAQLTSIAQGDFPLVSGGTIESCQKEKDGVGCTDSGSFSSYVVYARPLRNFEFQFFSCVSQASFTANLRDIRAAKVDLPRADMNCKLIQNGNALSLTAFTNGIATVSSEARGLSNVAGLTYYALLGDYLEEYPDASHVAPDARIFFANSREELLDVLRSNGSRGPVINPGIYNWNSRAIDYLVYRVSKSN